jgi:hypothetical protein
MRRYINGNYQIPLCELAYFHGLFTGSEAASEEYEHCVELLCDPVHIAPRWRGYGLRLERSPTRDDWHDAVGHFTEVPGSRMRDGTFDGEYAQLQLDYLIRLWLLTRDPRMLRYANAVLNAILPYVDRTTWQCDFRSGSRRQQIVPFWNAGVAAIVLHDPRPEFSDEMVRSQFSRAIDRELRARAAAGTIDDYCLRAYGLTLLGILVAASPMLLSKLEPFAMSTSRRVAIA